MIPDSWLITLAIVGVWLMGYIGGHYRGYCKGMVDPRDKNGYYRKRTWKDYLPWG